MIPVLSRLSKAIRQEWKTWLLIAVLPLTLLCILFIRLEPRYEGIALSDWLRSLNANPDDGERREFASVSNAVNAIGPRALPVFMSWLQLRDSKIKNLLAKLSSMQSWVDINIERTESRRELAAIGLQLLGSNAAPAIPMITPLLDDPELSETALGALYAIGMPALGELVSALTNRQPITRQIAMMVLASETFVDAAGVLPALLPLLEDGDIHVQIATIRTLARLEQHAQLVHSTIARLAARRDYPGRNTAIFALVAARADPAIVLQLYLDAMNDPQPNNHGWAVSGLNQIQSEEVMEALMKALADTDPSVRARAARGLGRYREHSQTIIPRLVTLLTNDLPIVQSAAARGLAAFGSDATIAVPHLIRLYQAKALPQLTTSAAWALLTIDSNSAFKLGIDPPDDSWRTNGPYRSSRPRKGISN